MKRARLASVRVSPGGYLATVCVLTFAATLLLRAEYDSAPTPHDYTARG